MSRPRLVLVRPRNADNLVSIARVMRTFGWTEWVSVSPAHHHDGMLDVLKRHRPVDSSPAELASLQRVDSLDEALSDCSLAVGTTMRTLPGRARLTSRELGPFVAARGDATWALVFGAEANGLQNDDLAHCHVMSFIPSAPTQPSLNLSQAVMVYAHELHAVSFPSTEPLADEVSLQTLRTATRAGLAARGFPQSALTELLAPLMRAGLTPTEVGQWNAAWAGESSPSSSRG